MNGWMRKQMNGWKKEVMDEWMTVVCYPSVVCINIG